MLPGMALQLILGGILILFNTLIAGGGYLILEQALFRVQPWLMRPPHWPKLLALLCAVMAWLLLIITLAVWTWALVLWLIGVFITMEASVYFSIVAFTTLGFGDILLPHEWRLLAGMSAVNGLVMIGLLTAMMVEVLRRVRNIQTEGRTWTS
jgi:hypothetical protein